MLKNVNFTNIVVAPGSSVIKTANSICNSGNMINKFIYDEGVVSFINNGYEVIHENPLASFMTLCKFKEIIIKNVNFTINIFSGVNSKLMRFVMFYRLELNNIKVDFEISSRNLIDIDQRRIGNIFSAGKNFMNSDHIIIANSEFSYIVANRLISIQSETACLNLKFENNSFNNIEVNTSIISYWMGSYSSKCIDGEYVISSGQVLELTPKALNIKNNSLTSIFAAGNMLNLINVGRLSISETLINRNRNFSIGTFDTILSKISKNNGYATLNTLPLIENCQNLIYVSLGAYMYMTKIKFRNNLCAIGEFFLIKNKFEFNDSEIINSTVYNEKSMMKFQLANNDRNSSFSKPTNYYFQNLKFIDASLQYELPALIEISELMNEKIYMSDLQFTRSDKAIKTQGLRNLEIYNISIINSTSKSISGVEHVPTPEARLKIDLVKIENSSQFLSVSSSQISVMRFELSEVKMLKNNCENLIYVSNMIKLINESYALNNEFKDNIGMILNLLCSGNVIIDNNIFIGNYYHETAILTAGFDLSFVLNDNQITFNSGRELILSVNFANPAQIQSFNNVFEYNIGSCFIISCILFNDSNSIYNHNINSIGTILYAYNKVVGEFKYSVFNNNSATKYGIVVVSLDSFLNIFNVSATENKSIGKGGFLFIDQNSTFNLVDSTVERNEAFQGSCIFSHYSHDTSFIKNTQFIKNRAVFSACINMIESRLKLVDSIFIYNTGAYTSNLHLSVESSIQIASVSFDSKNSQGTNIIIESRSTAIIVSSKFQNIHLPNEIGIFSVYDSHLLIQQSKLQNCSSLISIYCDNS